MTWGKSAQDIYLSKMYTALEIHTASLKRDCDVHFGDRKLKPREVKYVAWSQSYHEVGQGTQVFVAASSVGLRASFEAVFLKNHKEEALLRDFPSNIANRESPVP